jgi:hypothetical protein
MLRDNRVSQRSNAFEHDLDLVAVRERHRRIAEDADSGWGPGQD